MKFFAFLCLLWYENGCMIVCGENLIWNIVNLLGKGGKAHSRKSSQSSSVGPPGKKSKNSAKDVLTEAGKHGNYVEVALFDKVHVYSTVHVLWGCMLYQVFKRVLVSAWCIHTLCTRLHFSNFCNIHLCMVHVFLLMHIFFIFLLAHYILLILWTCYHGIFIKIFRFEKHCIILKYMTIFYVVLCFLMKKYFQDRNLSILWHHF